MTENLAAWQHGAVQFPLVSSTDNSLLEDADPALNAAIELLAAAIHADVGDRLAAEAALHDITISNAVAQTLHSEPTPFLYANQLTFPTLAVYRKSEEFSEKTIAYDQDVAEWEFAYVLPALTPVQIGKLAPILRAVSQSIRKAIRDGFHAAYESGAVVWGDVGVQKARVMSVRYGGYDPIAEIPKFYRALVGTIVVSERDVLHESTFEALGGTDINIDVKDPVQKTVVTDFVQVQTWPAPTLTSVAPATGSIAGGTSITLTGTGFRVGTLPTVTIGGLPATSVNVAGTTSITCVTPAHEAYDTLEADIVLTNIDGQEDTLTEAFTYTTP